MIKRNDLVRQFEEIVKQEIINHNLSIEASNQAVNKIEKTVLDLEKTLNRSVASIDSTLNDINIKLKQFNEEIKKIDEYSKSKFNDVVYDISTLNSDLDRIYDFLTPIPQRLADLELEAGMSRTHQNTLLHSVNCVASEKTTEISRECEKIRCEIKDLENRLSTAPSKVDAIKDELEKKIAEKRVDFDGVQKELFAMKSKHQYAEKKIEDLYTQLGRKSSGAKL